MRRLLWLCPPLLAVEVWRRGLVAPLAYGVRCHWRSRPDRFYEPEGVA